MSPRRVRPTRWLALAATSLLLALAPPAASGAQRLESFALPSLQGNIDLSVVKLNKTDSLRATVLLPDGYDDNPGAEWPVLYMLQGIGDNSEGWAKPGTGNIAALSAGFKGIIVMPEAGRDFFMDWWKGGQRTGPNWTRYYLDEVIPAIEARYKIRPGRQFHAIGGISMGGYGALLLGGQLPGYFGSIVSMSGLVDSQNPESYLVLPQSIGAGYEGVWGPVGGPYATVSNPMKTGDNVAHSRIYLSVGNGVPDPMLPFNSDAWTKGAAIESLALAQNIRYNDALYNVGAPHVLRLRGGVHDWPYWRREVPRALAWNVFAPPPYPTQTSATRWIYKTMAQHGNVWGLGYRFWALPATGVTFMRSGQTLRAYGYGTVTISPGAAESDASGAGSKPECAFTATVPFQRVLPAGC